MKEHIERENARNDSDTGAWLTKTTEEIYYRLLNDEWFQFDYYVDHAPKKIRKAVASAFAGMLHRNDLLLAGKRVQTGA